MKHRSEAIAILGVLLALLLAMWLILDRSGSRALLGVPFEQTVPWLLTALGIVIVLSLTTALVVRFVWPGRPARMELMLTPRYFVIRIALSIVFLFVAFLTLDRIFGVPYPFSLMLAIAINSRHYTDLFRNAFPWPILQAKIV